MPGSATVTILFTDLVGSTELAARLGDDAADDIRRGYFAALRSALAATAGEEVKTLGDGIMAAFSSTVDAIEAAVRMEQAVDRLNRRSAVPRHQEISDNLARKICRDLGIPFTR